MIVQIVVFLSHQRKRDNVLILLHPYQPGKLLAKRQSGDGEQQVKEFNILQGQSQQEEEEGEEIPKVMLRQLRNQRDGTTSLRDISFSTIIKKSWYKIKYLVMVENIENNKLIDYALLLRS